MKQRFIFIFTAVHLFHQVAVDSRSFGTLQLLQNKTRANSNKTQRSTPPAAHEKVPQQQKAKLQFREKMVDSKSREKRIALDILSWLVDLFNAVENTFSAVVTNRQAECEVKLKDQVDRTEHMWKCDSYSNEPSDSVNFIESPTKFCVCSYQ